MGISNGSEMLSQFLRFSCLLTTEPDFSSRITSKFHSGILIIRGRFFLQNRTSFSKNMEEITEFLFAAPRVFTVNQKAEVDRGEEGGGGRGMTYTIISFFACSIINISRNITLYLSLQI